MNMQIMRNASRTYILILLLFAFLLSACAGLPDYEIPKKEYTVAVLPLYNATDDLDGPTMVRKMFDRKLQAYYTTMPLDRVDQILRDRAGITLGGQLPLIEPTELGEILGVDGLVYGYLLNFEDIKTVFYNCRRVRVGIRLVDTKTGSTVWARGQGVRSITGMFDAVPSDERLQEFMKIRDIEKIPGITEWHDVVNVPSMIKEDARTLLLIPFIAAADTLLSLGAQLGSGMTDTHLYTYANDATNRILQEIVQGKYALFESPERVPKLLFPAFPLFEGIDLTAEGVLRTKNLRTGEELVIRMTIRKKGALLRSDSRFGEDRFAIILDRKTRKGFVLLPEFRSYADLDLREAGAKVLHVEKAQYGEEMLDGIGYDKLRVAIFYEDAPSQEGILWESQGPIALPKKVRLKDGNFRIELELNDIDAARPSDDVFQVPEGYTRRKE